MSKDWKEEEYPFLGKGVKAHRSESGIFYIGLNTPEAKKRRQEGMEKMIEEHLSNSPLGALLRNRKRKTDE